MMIRIDFVQIFVLFAIGSVCAEPKNDGEKSLAARFFDDGAFRKLQTDQARVLQAKRHLVNAGDFSKQLERRSATLSLPEVTAPTSPHSLKELYWKCSESICSIVEVRGCEGCGEAHITPYGTAFAITAGGPLTSATQRNLF
jgi:hypothetical protein